MTLARFSRGGSHNRSVRFILCALLLVSVSEAVVAAERLAVVATSADLKSIADAVGGDRVAVESLLDPEQDPHTVELKPSDVARARGAALVLRIGLDHEPWFARLKLPRTTPVLDASRHIRLLQTATPRLRVERRAHVHGYGNTHYWLDPANGAIIAADIRDAFSKISAADAASFERNRAAFVETLEARRKVWTSALAPFRGTRVVVVHDSWSYFADAFGLEIVAAAEPHPGVPPSPGEFALLLERMREANIRILIVDPSSNPALVRRIAERTGARAVTLQPSGRDYIRLFDENVARLAAALRAAR